ncbi:hypothetical protein HNP40_002408 [Mycobacteroides chelonae]|nr:hypothetical protein [Mycobacteroides chelonae]
MAEVALTGSQQRSTVVHVGEYRGAAAAAAAAAGASLTEAIPDVDQLHPFAVTGNDHRGHRVAIPGAGGDLGEQVPVGLGSGQGADVRD